MPSNNRRELVAVPSSAIDQETALLERANTDPGTSSPGKFLRNFVGSQAQFEQVIDGGADGQGHLRARSEPRMLWYCLSNLDADRIFASHHAQQAPGIFERAF